MNLSLLRTHARLMRSEGLLLPGFVAGLGLMLISYQLFVGEVEGEHARTAMARASLFQWWLLGPIAVWRVASRMSREAESGLLEANRLSPLGALDLAIGYAFGPALPALLGALALGLLASGGLLVDGALLVPWLQAQLCIWAPLLAVLYVTPALVISTGRFRGAATYLAFYFGLPVLASMFPGGGSLLLSHLDAYTLPSALLEGELDEGVISTGMSITICLGLSGIAVGLATPWVKSVMGVGERQQIARWLLAPVALAFFGSAQVWLSLRAHEAREVSAAMEALVGNTSVYPLLVTLLILGGLAVSACQPDAVEELRHRVRVGGGGVAHNLVRTFALRSMVPCAVVLVLGALWSSRTGSRVIMLPLFDVCLAVFLLTSLKSAGRFHTSPWLGRMLPLVVLVLPTLLAGVSAAVEAQVILALPGSLLIYAFLQNSLVLGLSAPPSWALASHAFLAALSGGLLMWGVTLRLRTEADLYRG